jgi:hypothetical protein
VRGCATDEQYQQLLERIVEALALASKDFNDGCCGDGA